MSPAFLPVVAIVTAPSAHRALAEFFAGMPTASGTAYVVIEPAVPRHASLNVTMLGAFAGRETVRVTESMPLIPERIHLAPPGRHLSITADLVYPCETPTARAGGLPADFFLRALADERGEQAVAVVLGSPSPDALRGVRAVEEEAGLVLADGDVGGFAAHWVGPAPELAQRVADYVRHLCAEPEPPQRLSADLDALAARLMPQSAGMPAVLVDHRGEILYLRGRTGRYLEPASGTANWSVYAMARGELKAALLAALPEVLHGRSARTHRRVTLHDEAAARVVELDIAPAADPSFPSGLAVVTFQETSARRSSR
ncbi:MAG TPA: chemotaxis protein CheB [Rhodocyclaceae bacterium]